MQPSSASGKRVAPAAAAARGDTMQLMNAPQPAHQHMPLAVPLPTDSAVVFYGVRQGSSDSNVPNTGYANTAPAPPPPPPYVHPASGVSLMPAQNSLTSPLLAHAAPPERHQPPTSQHSKEPLSGRDGQLEAPAEAPGLAEGGDASVDGAPPTIVDNSDSSGENSSVQDESTSAEPMVQRNVYISGLSSRMRSNDFRELCQRFGRVEASKLCIEGPTNPSKGYGFVLFYTEESAAACIKGLQGSYLHGRCLQARLADANATPAQARGHALSNLHPSLPRERRSRRGGAANRSAPIDPASMSTSGPSLTSPSPTAASSHVSLMPSLPPGTTLLLSPDQAAALQRAMSAQGQQPHMSPITSPPSVGAPGAPGMYYLYQPPSGVVGPHAYSIAPPPPAASMPPSLANLVQSPSSIVVPINAAGQPHVAPYAFATAANAATTTSIATPPHAALSQAAPLMVYTSTPPHQHAPGRTMVVSAPGQAYLTGHTASLQLASTPPLPAYTSHAPPPPPPPQYILATAPSQLQSPSYATVTTLPYGTVLPPGVTSIYPPSYPM